MPGPWRASLTHLHSWAGLVLGLLLFAIFWTGTLSVFDRELDRWMLPATRLALPPPPISLDRLVLERADPAAGSTEWSLHLPRARQPYLEWNQRSPERGGRRTWIDPTSGATLPWFDSVGATGFFFPFHYSLLAGDVGIWIVGIAAVGMLVLLVSGVVIHHGLLSDVFTLRLFSRPARTVLDLHNVSGVIILPFHLMITVTGLAIYTQDYLPGANWALYGVGNEAVFGELYGDVERPRAGMAAGIASLDGMVAEAERRWQAHEGAAVRADRIDVLNPFDRAGIVQVRRIAPASRLGADLDVVTFDAASGAVLAEHRAGPVRRAHAWLQGFHLVQFEHAPLRWLYFLFGLAGCALIATGLLFWLAARRKRHLQGGVAGYRLLRALTIGGTTGLVLASLAFLLANRLLPEQVRWAGFDRSDSEILAFFVVWLLACLHAALRGARAWCDHAAGIALAALAAAVANWVTTSLDPLAALAAGQGAVAGVDLVLLVLALGGGWAALVLATTRPRPLPLPLAAADA